MDHVVENEDSVRIFSDCRNAAEFKHYFGSIEKGGDNLISNEFRHEIEDLRGEYVIRDTSIISCKFPIDFPPEDAYGIFNSISETRWVEHSHVPDYKSIIVPDGKNGYVLVNTDLSVINVDSNTLGKNISRMKEIMQKKYTEETTEQDRQILKQSNINPYVVRSVFKGNKERLALFFYVNYLVPGENKNTMRVIPQHYIWNQGDIISVTPQKYEDYNLAPDLNYNISPVFLSGDEGAVVFPVNDYSGKKNYPAFAEFVVHPDSNSLIIRKLMEPFVRNYNKGEYSIKPRRTTVMDAIDNNSFFAGIRYKDSLIVYGYSGKEMWEMTGERINKLIRNYDRLLYATQSGPFFFSGSNRDYVSLMGIADSSASKYYEVRMENNEDCDIHTTTHGENLVIWQTEYLDSGNRSRYWVIPRAVSYLK